MSETTNLTEKPSSAVELTTDLAIPASDVVSLPTSERSEAATGPSDKSTTAAPTTKEVKTERQPLDESLDINFDDFERAKLGLPAEPKTTTKAAPDTKAADITTKPAEVKSESGKPSTRDFTGFTDQEAKLLRDMRNESYEFVAPQLRELKKVKEVIAKKDNEIATLRSGKTILPDTYYEHPQGFVLSPEFNGASNLLNIYSDVQTHWEAQLAAIRKGEKWKDINYNKATGSLEYGAEHEATAEDEAKVFGYLHHTINNVSQSQAKVWNLQNEFKARHTQAVETVRGAEKQYFGVFDDPNHPLQAMIKDITNMFPPEFRNNPVTSLAAKAVVTCISLQKQNKELIASKSTVAKVEEKKAVDKKLAGPTESDISGGGSPTKGSEVGDGVSYDDFLAVRNR